MFFSLLETTISGGFLHYGAAIHIQRPEGLLLNPMISSITSISIYTRIHINAIFVCIRV